MNKSNLAIIITIILTLTTILSQTALPIYSYSLLVSTDKKTYYQGETVRISGGLSHNGSGVPAASICISIRDPRDIEVFNICIMTDSSGTFSALYTAGNQVGAYSVSAEATSYGISSGTGFSVVSKDIDANANGPYIGIANQSINFTGTANGGRTPYSWRWDLGDGNYASSKNPLYIYQSSGNYTVTLTVQDSGGYQGSDTTYAKIADDFIVEIEAPSQGALNAEITFNGIAIGGFPPYSWHWDFGDGETSTEQNTKHSYDKLDEYIVNLTVSDQENFIIKKNFTITIVLDNPPDSPIIKGPSSGKTGVNYLYNITTVDIDNDKVYYYIDWGDNTTSEWIGLFESEVNITINHTWTRKGTYNIKTKAKDDKGLESDWSDPLTVEIQESDENSGIWFAKGIFQYIEEDEEFIYIHASETNLIGFSNGFHNEYLESDNIKLKKPFIGLLAKTQDPSNGFGFCTQWKYY
jgi:PKD repeat protein